jgi:hypothetical protein
VFAGIRLDTVHRFSSLLAGFLQELGQLLFNTVYRFAYFWHDLIMNSAGFCPMVFLHVCNICAGTNRVFVENGSYLFLFLPELGQFSMDAVPYYSHFWAPFLQKLCQFQAPPAASKQAGATMPAGTYDAHASLGCSRFSGGAWTPGG